MAPELASMAHDVLEDHLRLRRSATALGTAIQSPTGLSTRRGELAGRIVALRHQLADHFAAEERGGLFERIQQADPGSADACARLRQQHVAILSGLDRALEALPPAAAGEATLQTWTASIRVVLEQVSLHEEREAKLAACSNDPGGLARTPNCVNARQAARLEGVGSLRDLSALGLPEDAKPEPQDEPKEP